MTTRPILLEASKSATEVLRRYDFAKQELLVPEDSEFWSAVKHAHTLGRRGEGRRIAILDTDCDLSFGQLKSRIIKRVSNVPPPATDADLTHGTAVALLIVAVAPDCELEVYNVVRDDGAPDEFAIRDAIGEAVESGATIVNLSLGRPTLLSDAEIEKFWLAVGQSYGRNPWCDLREGLSAVPGTHECLLCPAVEQTIAKGARVVAAAGNDPHQIMCPARVRGALATAYVAVDHRVFAVGRELAERARGQFAPDQSILCDWTVRDADGFPGTSFAAPLVSGMMALCRSFDEFDAYLHAEYVFAEAAYYIYNRDQLEHDQQPDPSILREAIRYSFKLLPHVHCDFHASLNPDLPWTDPSACPVCGILAREIYVNGGLFFLELRELEAARSLLWAAHRLMPSNPHAAANLAKTLEMSGDYRQALDMYDYALKLRPGFAVYETSRDLIKARLNAPEARRAPGPAARLIANRPSFVAAVMAATGRNPTVIPREAMRHFKQAWPYFDRAFKAAERRRPAPPYDRESVELMEEAARMNLPSAQYVLGTAHLRKLGVLQPDPERAFKWLLTAALAGRTAGEAECDLAFAIKSGSAVDPDWRTAVEWLEDAAGQGNPRGMVGLAEACEKGLGVPQSFPQALKWLELASAKDNIFALQRAGYYLAVGFGGIAKDHKRAIEYFRRAASKDEAKAKYCLGVAYENGHGVAKDLSEARKWYKAAAAQGDSDAQRALDRLSKS